MKLEEYQTLALDTLNPDLVEKEVLAMCGLGLTGEAGEVADILKKYLYHHKSGTQDKLGKIILRDELGDVLWYVSVLASTLELTLEEIMQANIEKLHKRHSGGFTPHYVSDSVYGMPEEIVRLFPSRFPLIEVTNTFEAIVLIYNRKGVFFEGDDSYTEEEAMKIHDKLRSFIGCEIPTMRGYKLINVNIESDRDRGSVYATIARIE